MTTQGLLIAVAAVGFSGCVSGGGGGGGGGATGGSGGTPGGEEGASAAGSVFRSSPAALFEQGAGRWRGLVTGSDYTSASLTVGTDNAPGQIVASIERREALDGDTCTITQHAVAEVVSNGASAVGATYTEVDCDRGALPGVTALVDTFVAWRSAPAAGTGLGLLGGEWTAAAAGGGTCSLGTTSEGFMARCAGVLWQGTWADGMLAASASMGAELAGQRQGGAPPGPAKAAGFGVVVADWSMVFSETFFSGVNGPHPSLSVRSAGDGFTVQARWRLPSGLYLQACDVDYGVDLTLAGDGVTGEIWADGRGAECPFELEGRSAAPIVARKLDRRASPTFGALGGTWRVTVDGTTCDLFVDDDRFQADCPDFELEGAAGQGVVTVRSSGGFEMATYRAD